MKPMFSMRMGERQALATLAWCLCLVQMRGERGKA